MERKKPCKPFGYFLDELDSCSHNSTGHMNQKVETAQMPISEEQRNQVWSICMMEYYLAIKRKRL